MVLVYANAIGRLNFGRVRLQLAEITSYLERVIVPLTRSVSAERVSAAFRVFARVLIRIIGIRLYRLAVIFGKKLGFLFLNC